MDSADNIAVSLNGLTLAEEGGEVYLIYGMSEVPYHKDEDDRYVQDYEKLVMHINCYNLTRKRWVYSLKKSKAFRITTRVYGDLVIFANHGYTDWYPNRQGYLPGVWAYNWKTGEEVWELLGTDFDSNPELYFSPYSLNHDSGVLIFSSVSYAYGVDIRTGKIKWKRRGIGNSCSPFVFHRGVAYATSLGGYLHGWDLETGKTLLEARCPSEDLRDAEGTRMTGFFADIGKYEDPETGDAILVSRNLHYMYGFKAVR